MSWEGITMIVLPILGVIGVAIFFLVEDSKGWGGWTDGLIHLGVGVLVLVVWGLLFVGVDLATWPEGKEFMWPWQADFIEDSQVWWGLTLYCLMLYMVFTVVGVFTGAIFALILAFAIAAVVYCAWTSVVKEKSTTGGSDSDGSASDGGSSGGWTARLREKLKNPLSLLVLMKRVRSGLAVVRT